MQHNLESLGSPPWSRARKEKRDDELVQPLGAVREPHTMRSTRLTSEI